MMKIECERDEVAFIAVEATARISLPCSGVGGRVRGRLGV